MFSTCRDSPTPPWREAPTAAASDAPGLSALLRESELMSSTSSTTASACADTVSEPSGYKQRVDPRTYRGEGIGGLTVVLHFLLVLRRDVSEGTVCFHRHLCPPDVQTCLTLSLCDCVQRDQDTMAQERILVS